MSSISSISALPYPRDDPDTVERVGRRCDRLASWVDRLADDLVRDSERLRGAWEGSAAGACREELASVARLTRSLTDPLHACGRLLRAYALEVAAARRHVDRLREEHDALAVDHRRDIAGDFAGIRAGIRARHEAVLGDLAVGAARTAQRVVAATTAILPRRPLGGRPVTDLEADIVSLLPLLAESRRQAGVTSGPPAPGGSPSRPRIWWSALTSDEQGRLLATWPTQLGALDGLPAQARSRANSIRLERELQALRGLGVRTEAQQRRLDNCLVVRERLAYLRAYRDRSTSRPYDVQLLVFEPAAFGAEGRVAIGIGDVDTADNVAVMVPGLGSDVRSYLSPLTDSAMRVQDRAQRGAAPGATATVAWMGYDAPEFDNVGGVGAAERGADLLAADLLGWQAARDSLPHLTVVAHSYGSTTAGTSMRDHDTGTDDLVLLGSPGPNVEDISELKVPAGHVFVGGSSRDPVSYLDRFGADPTHEDFGALRFQAEDVTRNDFRLDVADHSKYYDVSSESLANVVRVVVGDYAAVRPAEYRGEAWIRPDGINDDPEADREPTLVR